MPVAARYLIRELLAVFLVVGVVLFVVAVGGRFIGYLQDAAVGKYAAESLLRILTLRLAGFLELLLPFALFCAVLLALGRLFADQEFVVLQASGLDARRVLRWLSLPVIAVAVAVAYLTFWKAPADHAALDEFVLEQRSSREFQNIVPGRFQSFQRGRRVTYAEGISRDRTRLLGVFLAERDRRGEPTATLWAESGTQYVDPATQSRFLLFENGRRYEGRIGEGEFRVMEFASLGQRVETTERRSRRVEERARSTSELLGSHTDEARAELHWRAGLVVLTLLGAVLAAGMSRVPPRQGRFSRILPAVGVFLGYYLLLVVGRDALADGVFPGAVGLWPIHGFFAFLAVRALVRFDRPVTV